MKILCLTTHLFSNNLSVPPYVFHKALLSEGHSSHLLAAKTDLAESTVSELPPPINFVPFGLSRMVRKGYFSALYGHNEVYFYPEWNLDMVSTRNIVRHVPFAPDIILAFWTKFAFNQQILRELSEYYHAPIVSVPLDMAPFTGGCHYTFGCRKYEAQCGRCPALRSTDETDLSHKTWAYKKQHIDRTNVTVLSCASTLTNQVQASSLLRGKPIIQGLLPVDEAVYSPRNRQAVRTELGISPNKKVILFGAARVNDQRKGLSYLVKALDVLASNTSRPSDILVLTAGHNDDQLRLTFAHKSLGYLRSESALAKAYQSADVFVCPSIEDSGPLMINQSIMCGTPVVAFDMGVAPDLVYTGRTGYLARLKDVDDLARGIKSVIDQSDAECALMRDACRSLGLEGFALSKYGAFLTGVLRQTLLSGK